MTITLTPARPHAASACSGATPTGTGTGLYLRLLLWAFTLFNSVRVVTYLPTILAIHVSADSSQHSLWTWGTWLGANVTMAAWIYEKDGRRFSGPVWVNIANAVMCAITTAQIVALRVGG